MVFNMIYGYELVDLYNVLGNKWNNQVKPILNGKLKSRCTAKKIEYLKLKML